MEHDPLNTVGLAAAGDYCEVRAYKQHGTGLVDLAFRAEDRDDVFNIERQHCSRL